MIYKFHARVKRAEDAPQDRQVLPGPLAPRVSSGGHSSPTGAWLENRGGSPAVQSFLFFSPTTCIPFKCIFIKIMVSELFNQLTNLYFSTGKRKNDVLKNSIKKKFNKLLNARGKYDSNKAYRVSRSGEITDTSGGCASSHLCPNPRNAHQARKVRHAMDPEHDVPVRVRRLRRRQWGRLCACGDRGCTGNLYLFPRFCWEPYTAPKNKIWILKNQ